MSTPPLAALTTVSVPARRLIGQLRVAGAITPHTAQPLHTQTPADEYTLRDLQRIGVIREGAPGTYYLDEGALETVDRQNRRSLTALGLGAILVLVIGAILWLLNVPL